MKGSSPGCVVAFDGPDGIGKTTQVQLAADFLRSRGNAIHTTRASGGTPIGEKLREVSLSPIERPPEVDVYISLAMHTALGFDLQERKKKGEICLVDRSPLAIIAYNVIASNLPEKELGYDACERMLKLWPVDLLIVFTAPQSVLDARRKARAQTDSTQANNYFEAKDKHFHQRIQEGYEAAVKLVHTHPEWGIKIAEISADNTIEAIQEQVQHELQALTLA